MPWIPWALSLATHGAILASLSAGGLFTTSLPVDTPEREASTVMVEVRSAPDPNAPDPAPNNNTPGIQSTDSGPIAPAAAVSSRQIVDLPSATGEEPDFDTPYLAERASRAVLEQRGEYGSPQNTGTGLSDTGEEAPGFLNNATDTAVPEPPPAAEAENRSTPLAPDTIVDSQTSGNLPLLPARETGAGTISLKNTGGDQRLALGPPPAGRQTASGGSCANPPCTQAVITNEPGASTDFLTGIELSGDITLLNAKSVTYAGFVRRVATNVFNQFIRQYRSRGWRVDPSKLDGALRVDAVLDASGNQELVFIRQSSGTKLWDDMGLDAMRKGAWDSNPPKGALSADGRIHFVFIVNHRQGILMAGIL